MLLKIATDLGVVFKNMESSNTPVTAALKMSLQELLLSKPVESTVAIIY